MGMGASQGGTHGRTLLLMSPARMSLRNSAGNSAASGFRRPANSVSVPLFQLAGRHNIFTSDVKLVPTVWPLFRPFERMKNMTPMDSWIEALILGGASWVCDSVRSRAVDTDHKRWIRRSVHATTGGAVGENGPHKNGWSQGDA